MDEINDVLSQPPAEPAMQQPQTPAQPSVDWKSKYDGLNGYAQQLKKQLAEAQQKYGEVLTNSEGLKVDLESRLKAIEAEHQKVLQDLGSYKSKAESFERQTQIRSTIRQNYPNLMDLFDDGLLRTEGLEGDALTEYLTKYSEREQKLSESAKKEAFEGVVKGTTPQVSGKSASTSGTVEDLQARMMRMTGLEPEYNEVRQAYFDALRRQGG